MSGHPMTSQLLAMSFDTPASPWISLREDAARSVRPSGWGFAWYPGDDNAAVVIKDPQAIREGSFSDMIGDWERFRSTTFVCHLRGAAKQVTQQDTHPFVRSYSGRSFIFAHSGDLGAGYKDALPLGEHPVFEPLGKTDSEHIFCWLLTSMRERGARTLAELGPPALLELLSNVNALGTANVIVADGCDIVAYRDMAGFGELHFQRRIPPREDRTLQNAFVTIDLSDPLGHNCSVVLFSTTPLDAGPWEALQPGAMAIARRAQVRWDSAAAPLTFSTAAVEHSTPPDGRPGDAIVVAPDATIDKSGSTSYPEGTPGASSPPGEVVAQDRPVIEKPAPLSEDAVISVSHETVYTYAAAVDHSTHYLRLRPVHDPLQEILEYDLQISPRGDLHHYEDVFGNQTAELELRRPYTELRIAVRARIRVRPHGELASAPRRVTIPLVWMPWQRQMMSPYLLPTELPETQLRELSQYAMSFVERQDHDLFEALLDMNRTMHRDFRYVAGSTTLETTPFEVYVHRTGVCQDFANLFICLARLLGIPARYRVGYFYTGNDPENRSLSEASHAWAEIYLPHVGWRGFDPTNGSLAGVHHVRTAVGRNYRDATPTAGTIYRGGGGEGLRVDVRVALAQ